MSIIFLYISNEDPWKLMTTGKYCPKTLVTSISVRLADCKEYCMQSGAKRLTYFPQTLTCRCCTEDSNLKDTSNTVEMYKRGNHVYVNIYTHIIDF